MPFRAIAILRPTCAVQLLVTSSAGARPAIAARSPIDRAITGHYSPIGQGTPHCGIPRAGARRRVPSREEARCQRSDDDDDGLRPATRLVRAGRDKSITGPFVNPPVVHASTVLFENVDDMLDRRQRYVYGRRGTPTSEALEIGGQRAGGRGRHGALPVRPLGRLDARCSSCLTTGDHVLMVDCVYGPVRHFADTRAQAARASRRSISIRRSAPASRRCSTSGRTRSISNRRARSPSRCRTCRPSPPSPTRAARRSSSTTPGRRRSSSSRSTMAPICRIQAGTKYLGGHSDVHARHRRGQRDGLAAAQGDPRHPRPLPSGRTTSISRSAACARSPSASSGRWQSAPERRGLARGAAGGRRASSIRRCPAIPATRSGSAT